MKPRLLDLFCGAGGASMGYHRAGFEVVGVDINPQPHYPFEFHQGDAMTWPLGGFHAVHASPPCQAYSCQGGRDRAIHPDLYAVTRTMLAESGKPYIIENVIGAPYSHGIILCGSMFGLPIQRHRNFETSWLIFQPECRHAAWIGRPYTITGARQTVDHDFKHSRQIAGDKAGSAMDMPWADWKEITQAIPPAYAEYIGRQLLRWTNWNETPDGIDFGPACDPDGTPTPFTIGLLANDHDRG